MKLKTFALLIPSLALGGCVDDILNPSENGVLPIPGITGLSYETDTLSGAIVNSQFKYKEGETVRIKLGNQTLLSLDSDKNYALANLMQQIPSTEEELNQAYFEEGDYDDFQVIANFLQLLHNLDDDNDYTNGFNLSQYAQNQNFEFDLSTSLNTFYSVILLQLADTFGSERSISPATSVGQLFSLADKHISIEQISQQHEDTDNNGEVDEVRNYFYDTSGFDIGYEQDENLDTLADFSWLNIYNEQGLLLSNKSETDNDGDGTYDRMWQEANVYNQLNLVTQSTFVSDHNGDSVYDYHVVTDYTHDSRGNTLSETEVEYDDQGSAESYSYTAHTYSPVNKVTQTDNQYDYDADGVNDASRRYSYTYNANGDLQQTVTTSDQDADGNTDETRVEQYTYNGAGLKTEEALQDYDSEGNSGFNQTQTWTYDADGNALSYTIAVDYYGDGELNFEGITQRTYDANGKLVTSLNENYREGELSDRYRHSYEYDVNGKQTKYLKEEDKDLDGDYDSSYTVVYTYTSSGNYATRTVTKDEDNDGTLEENNLITYTYNTNTKGEKKLLKDYLSW